MYHYKIISPNTIEIHIHEINQSEYPVFLLFSRDENGFFPDTYKSKKDVANIGDKATIEIASNGFLLKKGGEIFVYTEYYYLERAILDFTKTIIDIEGDISELELGEELAETFDDAAQKLSELEENA